MSLEPGIYQHYKGNLYEVLFTATHSETLEEMVIYKPLYDTGKPSPYWTRPLKMFTENIYLQGKLVPRFQKVTASN